MNDKNTLDQAIEVESLTKYHGTLSAVGHAHLTVRKDGAFGLLGAQGGAFV